MTTRPNAAVSESAPGIDRRSFLGASAAGIAALAPASHLRAQQPVPIVDCHIHLFDQTRPQGAPYTGGGANKLPALPARYRKLAAPLGIVAAIEIEASPWLEDNLWVLETIQTDPLIVGTCGNLQPEKPDFAEFLERFHRNPLFLGFRYGNLWGYNLVAQADNPAFIQGLRLTAQAGLTLDSANPRPDLVAALLKVKDKVPDLRMVLDHTAALAPGYQKMTSADRTQMEANLRDLARRPAVYFKISQFLRTGPGGKALTDAAAYQPAFDYLMDLFGEDRVIFGSDWPNSIAVDHLDAIVKIARDCFASRSRAVQQKYFWRNSLAAYRWPQRDPSQPRTG
jgi:L-fuconolactonase